MNHLRSGWSFYVSRPEFYHHFIPTDEKHNKSRCGLTLPTGATYRRSVPKWGKPCPICK
jgi:hypothetical protein